MGAIAIASRLMSDDPKTELEHLRAENARLKRQAGLTETKKRSVVKALTYRVAIICLDFLVVYVFTHKVDVALGFMVVSNIYTTAGYFVHERIWARVRWGAEPTKS